MKRIIALCLLLAMCLALFCACTPTPDPTPTPGPNEGPGEDPGKEPGEDPGEDPGKEPEPEPAKIVSRIAILSDAHINETFGSKPSAADKLKTALNQIKVLFPATDDLAEGADAILFSGDMTNNGTDTEYERFLRVIEESDVDTERTTLCYTAGNHEYYREGFISSGTNTPAQVQNVITAYNKYLGDLDTDTVINGMHIIGVSQRDCMAAYGAECDTFLQEHIEAAREDDPEMPIIIFSHVGYGEIWGREYGYDYMKLSPRTIELINDCPQIIMFSGHTHYASNDPRMIQQNFYTNVQLPTLGSKQWFQYDSSYLGDVSHYVDSWQGMLMTVDENKVVRLQRYDFAINQKIGQEWVIDAPLATKNADEAFLYGTIAERAERAAAPAFAAGTVVTPDEVTDSMIKFTFPIAHIDDEVSDDAIWQYRVEVEDVGLEKAVFSYSYYSEFYLGPVQSPTMSLSVGELDPYTDYLLKITAISCLGKESEPLTLEFGTLEEQVEPIDDLTKLIAADYADGKADDDCGHTSGGSATFSDKAAVFDETNALYYALTNDDYAKMNVKGTFTIEAVLSINKKQNVKGNNWGYATLVGNMETGGGGGFALVYDYNGKTLYATGYIGGVWVNATTKTVPLDEKFHVVGTCDGENLALYINGKPVSNVAIQSGAKLSHISKSGCQKLYVGADTDGGGSAQTRAGCTVWYVNLYAEGVSAGQVKTMYKNATQS